MYDVNWIVEHIGKYLDTEIESSERYKKSKYENIYHWYSVKFGHDSYERAENLKYNKTLIKRYILDSIIADCPLDERMFLNYTLDFRALGYFLFNLVELITSGVCEPSEDLATEYYNLVCMILHGDEEAIREYQGQEFVKIKVDNLLGGSESLKNNLFRRVSELIAMSWAE